MAGTGVQGLVALAVSGIIGTHNCESNFAQRIYRFAVHTTDGQRRRSCDSSNRTIRNINCVRSHPCFPLIEVT
jgi:hypothetical protein